MLKEFYFNCTTVQKIPLEAKGTETKCSSSISQNGFACTLRNDLSFNGLTLLICGNHQLWKVGDEQGVISLRNWELEVLLLLVQTLHPKRRVKTTQISTSSRHFFQVICVNSFDSNTTTMMTVNTLPGLTRRIKLKHIINIRNIYTSGHDISTY